MKFVHTQVIQDTHILAIAQKGEAFAPYHFQADEVGEWLGEVYPTLEAARSAGVTAINDKIDFGHGLESYSDGDTTPPIGVSQAYLDGWHFSKADNERGLVA